MSWDVVAVNSGGQTPKRTMPSTSPIPLRLGVVFWVDSMRPSGRGRRSPNGPLPVVAGAGSGKTERSSSPTASPPCRHTGADPHHANWPSPSTNKGGAGDGRTNWSCSLAHAWPAVSSGQALQPLMPPANSGSCARISGSDKELWKSQLPCLFAGLLARPIDK